MAYYETPSYKDAPAEVFKLRTKETDMSFKKTSLTPTKKKFPNHSIQKFASYSGN